MDFIDQTKTNTKHSPGKPTLFTSCISMKMKPTFEEGLNHLTLHVHKGEGDTTGINKETRTSTRFLNQV